MDKYELVERYEALGDEDDFAAARRLFEQDLTGRSGALDRRQYGYLLECHGRRTLRRAVDQYEQAMSLDPGQDKVQYQHFAAGTAFAAMVPDCAPAPVNIEAGPARKAVISAIAGSTCASAARARPCPRVMGALPVIV